MSQLETGKPEGFRDGIYPFGEPAAKVDRAELADGPYLIEATVARDDISPFLSRIKAHLAEVKRAAVVLG